MNVLFIHSHKFRIINSNIYSIGSLSQEVLDRYIMKENKLTVIARTIHEKKGKSSYCKITNKNIDILNIKDLKIRGLKEQIEKADAIIVRLPSMIGNLAIRYIKQQKKDYLVEVVGCGWDSYINHGIIGKILAPLSYLLMRKNVKSATRVLYVSNCFLQKRYPTKGNIISCSDVVLPMLHDDILDNRIKKINKHSSKKEIIIGTCGAINVRYKGQAYVIKALYKLKKQGINIKYELVGSGDNSRLNKLVEKYKLIENVVFLGNLNHDEVFKWLDNIDIYVQPSDTEGLCRALIEAMSRACPCIASNAGGNVELIDNNFIFKKKDVKDLANKIKKIINKNEMIYQSKNNFNNAKKYDNNRLERKRKEFYEEFINNNR